jgi:hypothetical protein
VDNWNNITNSQNRVRKKSFGGTFCFSNCHIIRLDTGGLVFLVSALDLPYLTLNKILRSTDLIFDLEGLFLRTYTFCLAVD